MIDYEFMKRHETEGTSIRQLAKEIGVHHNTLRREMIKAGIKIATQGESIANSIKSGTAKTRKGSKITDEHKLIIAKANKGKVRVAQTKNNFIINKNLMMRTDGARGNRKAAKVGSKFERMVLDKLTELGYNVLQQHKLKDYKIDLYIPKFRLAIEIDGITHREPIYGTDKLESIILKDRAKDRAMKAMGMHILRVQDTQTHPGKLNLHTVIETIKEMLVAIKKEVHVYKVISVD